MFLKKGSKKKKKKKKKTEANYVLKEVMWRWKTLKKSNDYETGLKTTEFIKKTLS